MSKNSIIIAIATLFLIGAIAFNFMQKRAFNGSLNEIKSQRAEIENTAELKELWSAKGMKSKLNTIVNSVAPAKKERYILKRAKADIKLNSLSDKELNRVLSKLAMLPLQFKKLLVVRSGDQFILECLCVW